MTTLAERIPVDEISEQARQVHFGRLVLTLIASVLYSVGWVAARLFFCVAWCGVAVRVGWKEGRGAKGQPSQPR